MSWIKIGLLAGAALHPAMALAQGEPVGQTQDSPASGSDIVVTAQRFEQRLQDVPLSVTAVSNEELLARNVSTLSDMEYAIPGLSTVEYGPGLQFVQIRGVSNSLGAPTVGVYLDEMPVTFDTQGSALDLRLIDMERVEVLRGPQATLYGEGSMGGTIHYVTASPDLGRIGGSAETEISGTRDGGGNFKAVAVLNLPVVTDRLGIRLAGGYEDIGGYIDSANTGQRNINDGKVKTIRAKILAKPTDRLRVSLLALHQESDQDNQNFGVDRRTSAVVPTFNVDNYDLFEGELGYDFGGVNLTASAGHINRRTNLQYDVTPFFLPTLNALFDLAPGFITQVPLSTDARYDISTGDIRLASTHDGVIGWLLGAQYRNSKSTMLTATAIAPGTLPVAALDSDDRRKSESYAIYGEVRLHPVEKLTLLGGLRYYDDKRSVDSTSSSFGFPSIDTGTAKFHSLNPRFNIQYAFSRSSMMFVNIAKGFRSGGFNLTSAGGGVTEIPPTYAPDAIWTYEFGTKQQILGNKLFLDASVYYSDWKGIQSYNFAPGSPLTIVTNGGKVSGWGIDLAVTARPVSGLTLTGTYSWNDLAYDNDTADKLKGDPVDLAVRKTWSASLDYRAPLFGTTDGFFRADYQHAGRAQITLRNFGGQIVDRPARDLVNLRTGLTFDKFEISVFANNVFDEDAPLMIGPFGTISENVEQRPRVIGLGGRMTF